MKFPEASEDDKKTGWEINYDFLAIVVQKLDCEDEDVGGSFLTEADVEAVLLAAQQVMKEQEEKQSRCTCERCTGIPCESLYEDNPFGLSK